MSTALGELNSWRPQSLMGQLAEEMLGVRFDNGFGEFIHEGMRGLARITGDKVEILAVHSIEPGRGHFRAMIERCKAEYRVVEILEIMNPALNEVLKRYGFKKFSRRERDGEKVTGWRWK